MTLRVSNNKINPAFGLFKNTIIKNIGSTVLLSLAMLIFCPGFFIAALSRQQLKAEYYTSPDSLSALFGVTTAFTCILICIANYMNFAYLYKKSSSDVFHALPLTRRALLISRAAAGYVGLLIPVTLGYISLGLMTLRYPTYVTGTISQIASAYLVNILLMLAFSVFSLIFIICAGNGFDLVISFCGFNVAVLIIAAILETLGQSYLKGFYSFGFFEILSPPYNLTQHAITFADNNYSLVKSGGLILDIVMYAVVFAVICPILYKHRKAERGEQAYAYKFIYVICSVLAGICGGYALSQIFVFATETKSFSIIGFISFIAGALITTTIYGAVTERGFKGFRRSIIIGGVSTIAYGITAVIILTGGFGFESRIPKIERISEVSVNFDGETVVRANPENAIALHKAILEKNAFEKSPDETADTRYSYITISYTLKNKIKTHERTMTREYCIDEARVKKELFDIYASEERFEKMNKYINTVTKNLEINGDYYYKNDEYESIYGKITKSNAKKLIATYRKELQAVGENYYSTVARRKSVASISLNYNTTQFQNEYFIISTTEDFPETNKMILKYKSTDEDEK